ncbi:cyclic di-GMP phosphodiesterase [Plesiomonas shigelloides]|uniref:cyclic di-GMP phosphodiesterase n=1 Tax=Plesiomonas shigelloides TaxID=703 RepID=UPI0022450448|nr:cyclic di-GMP phosphodiesterase [Plesiomonas shigelloides]MCX2496643.1 cyclic di-GMP phosphodiesterase [Plesiomonas shigelloides]
MRSKISIIIFSGVSTFILVFILSLLFIQSYSANETNATLTQTRIGIDQRLDRVVGEIDKLFELPQLTCSAIKEDLVKLAAFDDMVRSYLIVKGDEIYCSSSLGNRTFLLKSYFPDIRTDRSYGLHMSLGTAALPNKPIVYLWVKDHSGRVSGALATIPLPVNSAQLLVSASAKLTAIAIVIDDKALVTGQHEFQSPTSLPKPLASIESEKYGYRLYFFGKLLTVTSWYEMIFFSLTISMLVMMLIYIYHGKAQDMRSEILRGIREGQFFVVYQPVFNLHTQVMAGFEVLLRWKHPVKGLIPPDQFIAYAEHNGVIIELTKHMFELVAKDAKLMVQHFSPGMKLAVNISAVHLQSEHIIADLTAFRACLPAQHFVCVLEITERVLIKDDTEAERLFKELHDLGFELAIDDFGTGHSALIYLQKHKMDFLKIDKGFIQSIGQETVHTPVLNSILQMATDLSMKVVAEGVETEKQLTYLRRSGVLYAQGYYFSRPLTCEQLLHDVSHTD